MAVGLLVLVLAVGCRMIQPTASTSVAPPPGAAAAGLDRLAFAEGFEDADGLDLQNTRAPGFSFYLARPFGWPPTGTDAVSVSDGILTIRNPVNKAQFDLVSAVSVGKGQWTGFAPQGPAYFEAAIAFDPADFNPAPQSGFPAFWTMSAEHLFGTLQFQEQDPYAYLEIDFMEWNPGWHGAAAYIQSIHSWINEASRNRQVSIPRHHEHETDGKVIRPIKAPDWNTFNTFGVLWIPGDRIDTYFNHQLVRSIRVSDYPQIGVGDRHHFPVILGSGNFPMRVDWVRVWMP
jgi:hypothetical protein